MLEIFPCLGIFPSFGSDRLRLSLSQVPTNHVLYSEDEISTLPDSVAISQGGLMPSLIPIYCTPVYTGRLCNLYNVITSPSISFQIRYFVLVSCYH